MKRPRASAALLLVFSILPAPARAGCFGDYLNRLGAKAGLGAPATTVVESALPSGERIAVNGDRQFVSWASPGASNRTPGRVRRLFTDSQGRLHVEVEEITANGPAAARELTLEELNTTKTSATAKKLYGEVTARHGPIEVAEGVAPSGNQIGTQGDGQFVSCQNGPAATRVPARVKRMWKDPGGQLHVEAEILNPSANRFETRELTEAELDNVRQSGTAKQQFATGGASGEPVVVGQVARGAPPLAPRAVSEAEGRSLLESASMEGANPGAQRALLESHGLVPRESITINGTRYTFTEPFEIGSGRVGVLAVVESGGKRYLRAFYRSNSQATFRLLPATNEGLGQFGIPGFDKAIGEYALELPSEAQEYLAGKLVSGKVRTDVPHNVLKDTVPRNSSIPEWAAYQKSPGYLGNQVRTEDLLAQSQAPLHAPGGGQFRRPSDVRIASPGAKPDFSNPVRSFRTNSATAGAVDAMVYRSVDGSIEYTVFRDSTGRIWFANATSTRGVTSFGVPAEAYKGGELFMPRWEYRTQIPGEYLGAVNPANNSYYDAWKYLRDTPEIQAWYRAQGLPVPP